MIWQECLGLIKNELPQKDFQMWIHPLHAVEDGDVLRLLASNPHVVKAIKEKYLSRIEELVSEIGMGKYRVDIRVGNKEDLEVERNSKTGDKQVASEESQDKEDLPKAEEIFDLSQQSVNKVNPIFTFDNFVNGQGNEFAYNACLEVAKHPGNRDYNPLFIYGPTGNGKTHLLHAVGNEVFKRNQNARVLYITSERFARSLVAALKGNNQETFKKFYRSLDLLLIDDIQFLAGKTISQEEFFHIFNVLLEGSRQVILTSDRYHKDIQKLDDRLKSRCAWGLATPVEAPDFEMRVAILLKKAQLSELDLPIEAAEFIAKYVTGNVRELEGALNKVIAMARFKRGVVDMHLVRESLKDAIAVHTRQNSVENIQKVVAEYYRLPLRDLTGKSRVRKIARARQLAMLLSRELTAKSYPEIGRAFEGRDHSTVIHACETIEKQKQIEPNLLEDYNILYRTLQA